MFRLLFILGALIAQIASAQAELLLHYPLDEGSGTSVRDTGISPAAPGKLFGRGSNWISNSPTGAEYVYSVGDGEGYISGGTIDKLEGLVDFSVTFWVKADQIRYNDRIFSTRAKSFDEDKTTGFIDLMADEGSLHDSLKFRFEFRNGDQPGSSIHTGSFDASDWTFVGIVRHGRTVTFYVGDGDDSLRILPSRGRVSGLGDINVNSGEFRLLGTAASERNRSPKASLSDFRIYDAALSVNELKFIGSASASVSNETEVRLTPESLETSAQDIQLSSSEQAGINWDQLYVFSNENTSLIQSPGASLFDISKPYTAATGAGFVFSNDTDVSENGQVMFRIRKNHEQRQAVAVDARHYGKPALDRAAYTVRIDLPNGWYRVGVAAGDPAGSTALLAHVGDTFKEVNGVDVLDDEAINTLSLFNGSEGLSTGSVMVKDTPFNVTQGYVLVSFRRPPESRARWGSCAGIAIEKMESSSTGESAVLWLIQQGRFVPTLNVDFDGPSADYIRDQWVELEHRLTGRRETGVEASREPWRLCFRLSDDSHAEQLLSEHGVTRKQIGKDGFVIIPDAEGLTAVANNPYGLISAMFEVVRLGTGFEWVRPQADQPLVPVNQAYLALKGPVLKRPAFDLRGQALTQYDASREYPTYWNWLVRNGYNLVGGSIIGERFRVAGPLNVERDMVHNFFGHTLHELVPTETYFESHPEYFPMINGKRKGGYKGAQVNMANPEVVDVVVDAFTQYMIENPLLNVVSLGTNDTGSDGSSGWGEGADELAMDDPRDLLQSNMRNIRSYSTRYVKFANAITQKFSQAYPDVATTIYAYHETLPAPYVKPDPKLLVQFSPLYKSMNQAMNSTSSARNQQFNAWLKGWAELTDNILVRDYYVMFSRAGRTVLPVSLYVVQQDLSYYRELGLRGIAPETIPDGPVGGNSDPEKSYPPFVLDPQAYETYWDASWLVHYGLGRLMWEPDLPIRDVIKSACDVYYGPASPWMTEYYDRLNRYLYQSGRPEEVIEESQIDKSLGGRVHTGPYDMTWNWLPTISKHASAMFDLRGLEQAEAKQRLYGMAELLAYGRSAARGSGLRPVIERVERDVALFDLYTSSLGYGFEFRTGRTTPRILDEPSL
ncbi:DUF4838 domain-containing protein [Coraliomargarita sp. SDUM461004]|uniref:DUF4838 domain-containing protein n=1 Tax=Thalassobacterium sedimentorum TaxID=3041258 RepID=A0ABU1AIY3_9BACT|nr:DUF4838 domain-containing protein [Coraliomargarita sp. SDUM461004]